MVAGSAAHPNRRRRLLHVGIGAAIAVVAAVYETRTKWTRHIGLEPCRTQACGSTPGHCLRISGERCCSWRWAACCRAAWSAGPQKHEPAPHPKTLSRDFRLAVWVSKPTEELRLAAASLKLPVDWRTTPGDGLSWAAIVPRETRPSAPSDRLRGSECSEGYEVAPPCVGRANPCGKVATWIGQRTVRCTAGIAGGGCEEPRSGPPAASGRAQTLFRPAGNLPIPDHLESAAADRRHVHHRAMEDSSPANARSTSTISTSISGRTNTTIPIIRKPTETRPSTTACAKPAHYAHRLGIRTGVYIFPCQVPPGVYLAHPEAQAVEATNYHGINMCPSRAWETIVAFDTYLLRYFGSAAG